MKRKLFFFLEKLQISKSERIAVSMLMVFMIFSASITLFWTPEPQYSEAEYARLEKIFEEKSSELEKERGMILNRYEPLENEIEDIGSGEETEEALKDTLPPPENENKANPTGNLININSASASELQDLPGIGPAYSNRIVEWRKENGRFTSINQLLEIKGIGEKRLANIKPLVTL